LELPSLFSRRDTLCTEAFSKFTRFSNPRFLPLLPLTRSATRVPGCFTPNANIFTLPATRTERFKRNFNDV
jgi:hypothetical protein